MPCSCIRQSAQHRPAEFCRYAARGSCSPPRLRWRGGSLPEGLPCGSTRTSCCTRTVVLRAARPWRDSLELLGTACAPAVCTTRKPCAIRLSGSCTCRLGTPLAACPYEWRPDACASPSPISAGTTEAPDGFRVDPSGAREACSSRIGCPSSCRATHGMRRRPLKRRGRNSRAPSTRRRRDASWSTRSRCYPAELR